MRRVLVSNDVACVVVEGTSPANERDTVIVTVLALVRSFPRASPSLYYSSTFRLSDLRDPGSRPPRFVTLVTDRISSGPGQPIVLAFMVLTGCAHASEVVGVADVMMGVSSGSGCVVCPSGDAIAHESAGPSRCAGPFSGTAQLENGVLRIATGSFHCRLTAANLPPVRYP